MSDANEDNESADVALPWSSYLVHDVLKFTLDRWDDLDLGPTKIRVVGSVAGVTATVSTTFTITTVVDDATAEKESTQEAATTNSTTADSSVTEIET